MRNNRYASSNRKISSSTISSLAVHCQFPFAGGVSATPTIVQGIAYFPTWNGSFLAVDCASCKIQWHINVTQLINDFAPVPANESTPAYIFAQASRTSPQMDVQNGILVFGTMTHALAGESINVSLIFRLRNMQMLTWHVVAADLKTGRILGRKQLNPHPFAIITQSPTLYGGILYMGTSSREESAITALAGYKCCSFVGNAVALTFNRTTGRFTTLWDVAMLPADDPSQPGSWSGVGIWGSEPSIDEARRQVYYATGNVYTVPDAYLACTSADTTVKCDLPDRVWQESVLALDLYTGKVNWVRRIGPLDAWTTACTASPLNPALCPGTPGPDADFGMCPTFVPCGGKGGKDVLIVGQKNGILYSIAADNGEIEWATAIGPGSTSGGLSWGVAVDRRSVIYTAINSDLVAWTPQPANSTVITNSAYGAADLKTGAILWETAVLNNMSSTSPPLAVGDLVITGRSSPLSTSASFDGGIVAYKRDTGEMLLDFPVDTYTQSGISVFDKYICFGTGYHALLDGSFYVLSIK